MKWYEDKKIIPGFSWSNYKIKLKNGLTEVKGEELPMIF